MSKSMQSLNQDLFDIALKHALAELEEEQIKESCQMFDNLGEGTSLTAKARRNIKRIVKPPKTHSLRKVAAGFAILLTVLLGSTTVASALGFNWIKMLFRSQPQYSGFTVTDKTKEEYRLNEIEGFETIYLPSYIPIGFELSDVYFVSEYYRLEYASGENSLLITQVIAGEGGMIDYDTEDIKSYEEISIADIDKGVLIQKVGCNAIYMKRDDSIISVELFYPNEVQLSKNKLVRIAENLEAIDVK